MQIILGNGMELLQHLLPQQEQYSKAKKGILKNYFPSMKSIIDQERGFSLSEIRHMINQDDNTDPKKNEIKGFLIEEFGDFISFCDPERKNR